MISFSVEKMAKTIYLQSHNMVMVDKVNISSSLCQITHGEPKHTLSSPLISLIYVF